MSMPLDVFMGFDHREIAAYEVAAHSLVRRSNSPVLVHRLAETPLRASGIYDRPFRLDPDGFRIDERDGKPYSTEFAFTRFLVPYLCNYDGFAVFCDCDFLFRGDIQHLFDAIAVEHKRFPAVMVVKHQHEPKATKKMNGAQQQRYRRKNWSSMVLWNCGHPAHKALTPEAVNNKPGSWLHAFEWLEDDQIGSLPEGWNWLEGTSPTTGEAPGLLQAIHFTRGGPWLSAWSTVEFALEWYREKQKIDGEKHMLSGLRRGMALVA